MVGFFSRSHELNLGSMILQHCSAEILEYGDAAAVTFRKLDAFRHRCRKGDAASLHDYVNVIARSSEKAITYVSAYHKGSYAKFSRCLRHDPEHRMFEKSFCSSHSFQCFHQH